MKREYTARDNSLSSLKRENDANKEKIKHLKSAQVDMSERIKLKDSLLEKVIPNIICEKCEFSSGTLTELLEHIKTPHWYHFC